MIKKDLAVQESLLQYKKNVAKIFAQSNFQCTENELVSQETERYVEIKQLSDAIMADRLDLSATIIASSTTFDFELLQASNDLNYLFLNHPIVRLCEIAIERYIHTNKIEYLKLLVQNEYIKYVLSAHTVYFLFSFLRISAESKCDLIEKLQSLESNCIFDNSVLDTVKKGISRVEKQNSQGFFDKDKIPLLINNLISTCKGFDEVIQKYIIALCHVPNSETYRLQLIELLRDPFILQHSLSPKVFLYIEGQYFEGVLYDLFRHEDPIRFFKNIDIDEFFETLMNIGYIDIAMMFHERLEHGMKKATPDLLPDFLKNVSSKLTSLKESLQYKLYESQHPTTPVDQAFSRKPLSGSQDAMSMANSMLAELSNSRDTLKGTMVYYTSDIEFDSIYVNSNEVYVKVCERYLEYVSSYKGYQQKGTISCNDLDLHHEIDLRGYFQPDDRSLRDKIVKILYLRNHTDSHFAAGYELTISSEEKLLHILELGNNFVRQNSNSTPNSVHKASSILDKYHKYIKLPVYKRLKNLKDFYSEKNSSLSSNLHILCPMDGQSILCNLAWINSSDLTISIFNGSSHIEPEIYTFKAISYEYYLILCSLFVLEFKMQVDVFYLKLNEYFNRFGEGKSSEHIANLMRRKNGICFTRVCLQVLEHNLTEEEYNMYHVMLLYKSIQEQFLRISLELNLEKPEYLLLQLKVACDYFERLRFEVTTMENLNVLGNICSELENIKNELHEKYRDTIMQRGVCKDFPLLAVEYWEWDFLIPIVVYDICKYNYIEKILYKAYACKKFDLATRILDTLHSSVGDNIYQLLYNVFKQENIFSLRGLIDYPPNLEVQEKYEYLFSTIKPVIENVDFGLREESYSMLQEASSVLRSIINRIINREDDKKSDWDMIDNFIDYWQNRIYVHGKLNFLIPGIDAFNLQDYFICILMDAIEGNKVHTAKKIAELLASMPLDKELLLRFHDAYIDNNNHGIDAAERGRDTEFYIHLTLKSRFFDHTYTTLMKAIIVRNYQLAKAVIDSQAAVSSSMLNAVTKYNFSALMLAAAKYTILNSINEKLALKEIIMLLLNAGVDLAISNRHSRRYNFFFIASHAGLLDDEDILSAIKQNYDSFERREAFKKNHDGKNILHIAIESGAELTPAMIRLFSNCLNEKDYSHSTPLSYALFVTNAGQENHYVFDILEAGAIFLRNNREPYSKVHIAVLSAIDNDDGLRRLKDFLAQEGNMDLINIPDTVMGRTPLHLAFQQGRSDAFIRLLLAFGANPLIEDYAKLRPRDLSTHAPEVVKRGTLCTQPNRNTHISWSSADFSWLSVELTVYFDNANNLRDMLDKVKSDNKLSWHEKLYYLAFIKNRYGEHVCLGEESKQIDVLAEEIIIGEFSDKSIYPKIQLGSQYALGCESEIPELRLPPFVSIFDLTKWFNVEFKTDVSVHDSILMPQSQYKNLEITSAGPMTTDVQYYKFLALHKLLQFYGTRQNLTAGAHIHVNAWKEGPTTMGQPQALLSDQMKQLMFLKFLALNYLRVEPLLLGILRGGTGMNKVPNMYTYSFGYDPDKPSRDVIDEILSCYSVQDFFNKKIASHLHSLCFESLKKHGTIEFRLHDGIIDPVLWNAWVDFVTRIINISLAQANETPFYVSSKSLKAKDGIENLFYIFVLARQYSKTWNVGWGALNGSDTPPVVDYIGIDHNPAQLQLADSLLAKMMSCCVNTREEELETALINYFFSNDITEADKNAFVSLLQFQYMNRGYFDPLISKEKVDIVDMLNRSKGLLYEYNQLSKYANNIRKVPDYSYLDPSRNNLQLAVYRPNG